MLRSAAGATHQATAKAVGVSLPLVAYWRRRFHEQGLARLYDGPRPGRPRTHEDDEVARLLRTVLRTRPPDATHWTVRSVAARSGVSKSTVQRYFNLDSYATHKHPAIRPWLARHPSFSLHFTTTGASWLNLIEAWFSILTRRSIRRGSFGTVAGALRPWRSRPAS